MQGIEGVLNVFDDLLVFADSLEELNKRTEKVLNIMEVNGLTLNFKKCQFNKPEIHFLGHPLKNRNCS